jgi:hypothetical protein
MSMQPLEKSLRSKLERVVREARDIAEAAARASLEQLGVGEAKPRSYLNEDERKLGAKLRAHGRQLGDVRGPDGQQQIDRLVEEVAYQHWHRMLFARFLAENNLLMYPDPVQPIPITLAECEDLAAGEGARNGWELEARFAARMLPQIFRPESPIFSLALPPEHQRKLEKLLAELPAEVFSASDSLGWVYQFWQAKKKDEINASEVKIGARELPVVTQLFTEPYMVSFLLDNSLGAWWAARRLSEDDLRNAKDEEELRRKAALPGVPLDYLRFVRGEDGRWAPAAGTFEGWPESLKELKVLDPCCGSGHFLVAALPMLASTRAERENLSAGEAVDAVLRENLHGLEIDPRCVELAAFALGFAAWRYPGAGGYRMLPELNLACSGLAIGAKKEEWIELAGEDVNLQTVMEAIWDQFEKAPAIGSLINPKIGLSKGNLLGLKWEDVVPLLKKALLIEKDYETREMGVVAQGLTLAAKLLEGKYHLLLTNVPYLAINRYDNNLRKYIETNFNKSKNDLAFVFIDKLCKLAQKKGAICFVATSGWTFQNRERHFRLSLLDTTRWHLFCRLGASTFETISGEIVQVMLSIIEMAEQSNNCRLMDLGDFPTSSDKARALKYSFINSLDPNILRKSDDTSINFSVNYGKNTLGDYADALRGLSTGDVNWFYKMIWEITLPSAIWDYFQTDTATQTPFGGRSQVILWENESGTIARIAKEVKHLNHAIQSWRRGKTNWGKRGVAVNRMGSLYSTLYYGNKYSEDVGVLIPKNNEDLFALWLYCSSKDFVNSVRSFNKKVSVEPRYFGSVTNFL